MGEKTEQEQAQEMRDNWRGQYIIGQALFLAIKEIESRPPHKQEPSNVADMRFLMNNLYPLYAATNVAWEAEALRKLEENDEPSETVDSNTAS